MNSHSRHGNTTQHTTLAVVVKRIWPMRLVTMPADRDTRSTATVLKVLVDCVPRGMRTDDTTNC